MLSAANVAVAENNNQAASALRIFPSSGGHGGWLPTLTGIAFEGCVAFLLPGKTLPVYN